MLSKKMLESQYGVRLKEQTSTPASIIEDPWVILCHSLQPIISQDYCWKKQEGTLYSILGSWMKDINQVTIICESEQYMFECSSYNHGLTVHCYSKLQYSIFQA
uniref:Uncharacterized protein n=1 Tax=Micrurus paraensis TaxID=1970185 RepID=A0A2D4K171_9SAUR